MHWPGAKQVERVRAQGYDSCYGELRRSRLAARAVAASAGRHRRASRQGVSSSCRSRKRARTAFRSSALSALRIILGCPLAIHRPVGR